MFNAISLVAEIGAADTEGVHHHNIITCVRQRNYCLECIFLPSQGLTIDHDAETATDNDDDDDPKNWRRETTTLLVGSCICTYK
jgi:hypothetical protein